MEHTRILVVSDLHVGSTVGLWPPRHPIEDGGMAEANKFQRWLYRCWQDCISEADRMQSPILVVNGDIIQGANNRDGQLVSNLVSVQVAAAEKILAPLVEKCSRLYVVRGTEWHEGRTSEYIEQLAKTLGAVPNPATSQYTWWDLYLKLGGHVVHFAHHVGISSVPWYESTIPLRDTLMQMVELWRFYGKDSPSMHMVVRSHRHRFIHVDAPPAVQVVVTPAWQLKTALSYKRTASSLPHVGYVVIEQGSTGLVVQRRIYPLAKLHIEEVD